MESTNAGRIAQPEISLNDLMRVFRQERWLIATLAIVGAALGLGAALLAPKSYKASITISPAADSSGSGRLGGLSSVASQFGGLASLAGLQVPGDSKKAESVAILQSEALTANFIHDNNLLPILYPRDWDTATGTWKHPHSQDNPTLWQATERFRKKIRSVETDSKTGLVTLTVTWKDPTLAANWANGLTKMANDYLRRRATDEAERNIAYLNEQAAKTDAVGVKQAIYTLMENEISKEMLARGNDEYAFRILDPAVAPEKPYFPLPVVWTGLGLGGGLLLSFFIAFTRHPAPRL